ncbi:MAG: hypothetical protein GY772_28710 [bacterium]|nr:hypothetical protein [bacterium]
MTCAASQQLPSMRHDGAPLSPEPQAWCQERSCSFLPAAAILEKCGDWSWLKSCFNLRSWSTKHICWKCDAGADEHSYAEFDDRATWRQHPVSHETMLARSRGVQRVGVVSSLWDLPGFRSELVAIDLLHTLDLGCAAFTAGSLLAEELRELARGANKQERLDSLNRDLQAWYRRTPQRSQLHELTENMIQASGKAPNLAAKGAGCLC